MKQRNRKKDIAIIGMSCKFSSTESLADYWKSLKNGDELIEVIDEETAENFPFINVHSRMQDVESFDYAFFGYTKDEAKVMDPQIRVMHEQAWSAFENAGYDITEYKKQVGVFLSASDNINWRAYSLMNGGENVDFFKVKQLSNKNFLSTLISYSLNLKGPSYYIDTACSSSLSSIHIACRNLLLGECSMALAGGVSINTHVQKGYEYAEGMILSKDGHCRAFDADSSGTISGEGVGVVVLKRYEEAVRDGDHIYAVIRSSAANNDGRRKVGYTAPSVGGQSDCITLAQKVAGIQPHEVSYVEAHGTGTKIGDVIEIESLNKVFGYNTDHTCAIGSVKSNMGHLDAAAGVAGLIKTSLMLNNELLVPSLHFKAPNPEVNFKSGPFYVNTETKPWLKGANDTLIAGVSSFGIGGTNAHVLLESPEKPAVKVASGKAALITYSAASESSVSAFEKELHQFIQDSSPEQLQSIAYSLNTGRKAFDYRKYIVVEPVNDSYAFRYGNLNIASDVRLRHIAFAFSGQGTQYYQMGKDLYESEPRFKEMMDKGFELLNKNSAIDFKSVIGYTDGVDDPELIHNTIYTQPLLFLFEYSIAKLLMSFGIQPTILNGLSQGEYAAACLSGVFSFEDGLRIMEKRAALMDSLEEGEMVAVNAPYAEVEVLLPAEIQVAVINTATSCVISGPKAEMKQTLSILEEKDIDYTELKISMASHSKMMEPILEEFAAFIEDIPLSTPTIPFISSTTGEIISDENATSAAYWANHIRKSVNFSEGCKQIIRSNTSCIIEISPGASVSNLTQQNNTEEAPIVCLQSVRNAKEVTNDYAQMLQLIGQLWQNGISVDWDAFYNNEVHTKVPCPTYCFDKYKFNARVNVLESLSGFDSNVLNNTQKSPKDWLYQEQWKEVSIHSDAEKTASDWVVCFVNEHSVSQKIKEAFNDFTGDLYFVQQGDAFQADANIITINPKRSKDYIELGEFLSRATHGGQGSIVHAWSLQNGTDLDFDQCQDLGYFSLQDIARHIIEAVDFESLQINVLGNDLFKVYGNEQVNYDSCTLLAAVNIIPKEYENVHCRFIEYAGESHTSKLFTDLVENQFSFKSDENIIAIRHEKAWAIYHDKIQISNTKPTHVFEENGCYLITGASGGIGQVLSQFLLSEYNAKLILIGRSEIPQSLSDILSENVTYVQSNIEDEKRLQEGIAKAMFELNEKTLTGVFHTAGIGDYAGLIRDRSRSDCETIFSPKITGSIVLNTVCKAYNPKFLMLFSSLAALKNPFGQIGYAAANTYQNFMAKSETSDTRILSVLWDTWKESGMALKSDERIGVHASNEVLEKGITNKEGIVCIQLALQSNQTEVIVTTTSIEKFKAEAAEQTLFAVEAQINQEAENQQYSARPNIDIEYIEPSSELEIQIAELWSAFFGYDKIGVKDNFFELGGDSLKAMTILKRIEQITGLEIKLKEFYKSPTVESIVHEIEIFHQAQELQQMATGNTLRI